MRRSKTPTYLLLTICYLLLTSYYLQMRRSETPTDLLFTTHYLLLTAYCLLPTDAALQNADLSDTDLGQATLVSSK